LPLPAEVISDLNKLDAATNERKIAEAGKCAAIGPSELLFGVPEAQIVNAAFSHPDPTGLDSTVHSAAPGMPDLSLKPRLPRLHFTEISRAGSP